MLLVLTIALCVGSNACDFWMKVFRKRICLFHMLALLFHGPEAEDPAALGDGRATRRKEPGSVNQRDASQPRTPAMKYHVGEKELICYSS